jgi:hypothetical protein
LGPRPEPLLAMLWLNHNLPPQLGDDPEQLTREIAHHLF